MDGWGSLGFPWGEAGSRRKADGRLKRVLFPICRAESACFADAAEYVHGGVPTSRGIPPYEAIWRGNPPYEEGVCLMWRSGKKSTIPPYDEGYTIYIVF